MTKCLNTQETFYYYTYKKICSNTKYISKIVDKIIKSLDNSTFAMFLKDILDERLAYKIDNLWYLIIELDKKKYDTEKDKDKIIPENAIDTLKCDFVEETKPAVIEGGKIKSKYYYKYLKYKHKYLQLKK